MIQALTQECKMIKATVLEALALTHAVKTLAYLALVSITLLCTACEFSKDLNVKNLKGYEFNLHDIQEYCTVKRDGDRHLAIVCTKKTLNPLVHGCEGQMTKGLSDPIFSCGGGLWVLNKVCYIEMLDTHSGNIKCKKG